MRVPRPCLAALLALSVLGAPACREAGRGDRSGAHGHDEHEGHDDHDEREGHGEHEGHDEHDDHEDAASAVVSLGPEAARTAALRTATVAARTWPGGLQTTGEVHFDATRLAHVSPRLEGRIHRVEVAIGERVQRDQAIAVVDSVELGKAKAEYLSARARLDLAEGTLAREEGLLARRISSEQEVIEARAAREEAAARYRAAADTLRVLGLSRAEIEAVRHGDPTAPLFTVRAPLAGKLVELHATRGELVGPATELATVADLGRLWVWVDVYEKDLGQVAVGDRAEVRLEAFPDEPIEGLLAYLRDEVDRATRTARARIDLPNPDERIKPGMFARVLLRHPADESGTAARTIAVPASAVQREGEESFAFVQVGENGYERRELRLGRRAGGLVEVLAGLSPGERLVVEGGFLLKSELAKGAMGHGHSH